MQELQAHRTHSHRHALALLAMLACATVAATRADIREILAGPIVDGRKRPPHVALLFDTSASAAQSLPMRTAFDPAAAVALLELAGCDASRIYWRRGGGTPPDCRSTLSIARTEFHCQAALEDLQRAGYWTTRGLAQWSDHDGTPRWRAPEAASPGSLECAADRGVHGDAAGNWYAGNGDASHRWTRVPADEVDWSEPGIDDLYTLYDPGYLAWWHTAAREVQVPKSEALFIGAQTFAHYLGAGTLSALRYSYDAIGTTDAAADGGMVLLAPVTPADFLANESTLSTLLAPGGGAPLTETLYEATRYLSGESVALGSDSHLSPAQPWPSVAGARSVRDFSRYASPILDACQRSFIAGLFTAAGSQDASGEHLVPTLPDFIDLVGPGCDGSSDGKCLDELALYLSRTDLRRDLPGRQGAESLWLALDPMADTERWIPRMVTRHGELLQTGDGNLVGPLLAAAAIEHVTRPPAAVTALRTVTGSTLVDGEDLFVASIEPTTRSRWRGNLRRYRAAPVAPQSADWQIVDGSGQLALDTASGTMRGGAISLWSRTPDVSISDGGAAAAVPDPDERLLFTDLAGADLTLLANRLILENPGLSPMAFGLLPGERLRRDATLNWLQGLDTQDVDRDGNVVESRRDLGASAQARMAVVRYSRATDDGLLFAVTADGSLHALSLVDGRERWAYLPGELLPHLDSLRRNPEAGVPAAGLDADLVAWRLDADRDGRIQAGTQDRALLLFGLGHSGRAWLALDVTEPNSPRLLWRLTPAELPGLGLATARPVLTRLAVSGTSQSAGQLVAVLAGGFDPSERHAGARSADIEGNRLYVVDAFDGRLLWFAGGAGSGTPDLPLASMSHALTATPRVLDLDGDDFADRIYAADLGGQLWRFDLHNGAAAANLAQAGVIAALGNRGTAADADHRQFYFEPDVSLVLRDVPQPFLAITLGSGFLPHPLLRGTADRLYSVRDYLRAPMTAADWSQLTIAGDEDLIDVTGGDVVVPPRARGWKRRLLDLGEKTAGAARTLDYRVYVPTFVPPDPIDGADCRRRPGRSRLYALDLRTGRQVPFRVDETPEVPEPLDLEGQHFAQSLALLMPRATDDCRGAACRPRPVAMLGTEAVPLDFANRAVKTVWAEREAP